VIVSERARREAAAMRPNLSNHVGREHLLRGIDHFLDLRDPGQRVREFHGGLQIT